METQSAKQESIKLDQIESVIADIAAGKMIVLIDDRDRENEGDLVIAAEKATPEAIAFMFNQGRGLVCLSITEETRAALNIPLQAQENSSLFGTNFAAGFDHISVSGSGVTAAARAKTIREAVRPGAGPDDFVMPGYVFPVVAAAGGVLRRRGQTEGSVELARIAGLVPAGVICEVVGEDGTMLRGERLEAYCRSHNLKITSVEAIVAYRLRHEVSLRRVAEYPVTDMPAEDYPGLDLSKVRVVVYVDDVDGEEQLAFIIGEPENGCPVRIHSECLTGDVFSSMRCDCGHQFDSAIRLMLKEKSGVLIYLHQEGRGIGLGNKLRAYELQDRGRDTVDANLDLGLPADNRDYRAGAMILSDLGLQSIRLITNNPEKLDAMKEFGVDVIERLVLPSCIHEQNRSYLETKRDRMGHLLPRG